MLFYWRCYLLYVFGTFSTSCFYFMIPWSRRKVSWDERERIDQERMKSEISNLRWEKGSLDLKKNTVRGECSTSAFYNVLLKKCLGFVSLLRLIIRWLCKHLIFASTKKTGKDRADISWDARNDALSYEQLCYHDNQDFLKNVKSNVGSLTTFILSIIQ